MPVENRATSPITLTSDTAYATKTNIVRPGTSAAADAAEARADARIEDSLPTGTTVAGLSITGNGEA